MTGFSRRNFLSLSGSAAVAVLSGGANAAMGPNDKFDLVIKGGDVLDPSQGLRGKRDIGIRWGAIEAVENDIPVARITDEYLRYLRVMQELDIAVAGDFLVMAATLIELKTKMLLPRDPQAAAEEVDDPRNDLVNQLLEYQKYKAAAEMLWSRATVEQAVFKRAQIETDKNNPEVSVGLFDLLKVFQDILTRHKEEVMMEIEREEISMAEMLERLRNMVMSSSELNLRVYFERAKSRRELVLAFLSVLELVRTTEIKLIQRETFGDIIASVA